jgi:hypothetical protein
MGMFHLWEFWTTAGWNPNKLSVDGECRISTTGMRMEEEGVGCEERY